MRLRLRLRLKEKIKDKSKKIKGKTISLSGFLDDGTEYQLKESIA